MDVLSMIKHSLVADGVNPITKHFRLTRQAASAGPEMVWKIYDAVRISDGKVSVNSGTNSHPTLRNYHVTTPPRDSLSRKSIMYLLPNNSHMKKIFIY